MEIRQELMGHRNVDVTTRRSAPQLEEYLSAANRLYNEKCSESPAVKTSWMKTGQSTVPGCVHSITKTSCFHVIDHDDPSLREIRRAIGPARHFIMDETWYMSA
ncbi:MAG: hypothetical protein P8Y92_10515 [Halioglobus sp.]|jgi:hypothetical protein